MVTNRGSDRSWLQFTAVVLGLVFIITEILVDWRSHGQLEKGLMPLDFGAFYCAGATANLKSDPYLTVPFDDCGGRLGATLPALAMQNATLKHRLPAPVPGYDIALFRLLAKLPFPIAAAVWLCISVIAALVGIIAIGSEAGLPLFIVFLALAIGLREALQLGQVAPILLAALALAGYGLVKQRYVFAGVAATLALIEPHVGAAPLIAMFIWVPRTRITLAAGVAALCLISIATLGTPHNIDYVRIVLPAHVLASVPADQQYSLTWLLYALGVNERAAVRIGEYQFAIMAVFGIIIARSVAARAQSPALIPLVAAGFSVIGGPYIHLTQVSAVAVLPALVLAGRRNCSLAWLSLLLIALSWDGSGLWPRRHWSPERLECAVIVAVIAWYALQNRPWQFRGAGAAASLIFYLSVTTGILGIPERPLRTLDSPAQYLRENTMARDYASVAYGAATRASTTIPSQEALAAKIPTWIGLLLLLFSVVRVVWRWPETAQLGAIVTEAAGAKVAAPIHSPDRLHAGTGR